MMPGLQIRNMDDSVLKVRIYLAEPRAKYVRVCWMTGYVTSGSSMCCCQDLSNLCLNLSIPSRITMFILHLDFVNGLTL